MPEIPSRQKMKSNGNAAPVTRPTCGNFGDIAICFDGAIAITFLFLRVLPQSAPVRVPDLENPF
jgi:hypothetical protein